MDQASGGPAPTLMGVIPVDLAAAIEQIEVLKKQFTTERQQRLDAEFREAALNATLTATTSEPKPDDPDISATLNQLGTDYDTFLYTVDNHTEIPESVRSKLRFTLKNTVKNRVDRMRVQVTWLQNKLQESRNLAQTEAISIARTSILSIIQQLQSFNRQIRVPITRDSITTERGDTVMEGDDKIKTIPKPSDKTVPLFQWNTSNLAAAHDLSFNELLSEFKVTTESLIKNVEIANSLQKELRVTKASRWKVEREARDARNTLSEADLQLPLAPPSAPNAQALKDESEEAAHQLEEYCDRGEEMRLEIVRLRKLLQNARNGPATPGTTQLDPDDNPFTREEARTLYKLLGDYINHSSQYQKIILCLEKLLGDVVHYEADPAKLKAFQRDWLDLYDCLAVKPGGPGLKQAFNDLTTEKDKIQREIDVLQTQFNDLQPMYFDLLNQYDDLQAQYNDLQAQYDDLQIQLDSLQAQNDDNEIIIAEAKKKLKDCLEGKKPKQPHPNPPSSSPRSPSGSSTSGGSSGGGGGNSPPLRTPTPPPPRAPSPPPAPIKPAAAASVTDSLASTPVFTPGGTKRKAKPGARLRRETRANKRRAKGWYPDQKYNLNEPASPPDG